MKSIEQIKKMLSDCGIIVTHEEGEGHFNRNILFEVNDVKYTIEWYINSCTLMIGTGHRKALIPFKYMYFDNTYPLIGGNRSIGFSYTINENAGIHERRYPFESFRIPY